MSKEQHEMLQKDLVARLINTGYTPIYQNMEYRVQLNHKVFTGEIDVLAKSRIGKWHLYEIKTSSHKIDYAKEQYHRFMDAHPYVDVRGVFISLKKIQLL